MLTASIQLKKLETINESNQNLIVKKSVRQSRKNNFTLNDRLIELTRFLLNYFKAKNG